MLRILGTMLILMMTGVTAEADNSHRTIYGLADDISEEARIQYAQAVRQFGNRTNRFGKVDETFLPAADPENMCALPRSVYLARNSEWIVRHTERERNSSLNRVLDRLRKDLYTIAKNMDRSFKNESIQPAYLLPGEKLRTEYQDKKQRLRQRQEWNALLSVMSETLTLQLENDPTEAVVALKLASIRRLQCEFALPENLHNDELIP